MDHFSDPHRPTPRHANNNGNSVPVSRRQSGAVGGQSRTWRSSYRNAVSNVIIVTKGVGSEKWVRLSSFTIFRLFSTDDVYSDE